MAPAASARGPCPAIASAMAKRGRLAEVYGRAPENREESVRACLRMVSIAGFSLAATAGCTLKNANVPPAELMRQVQAGQPMLDCRAECSGAWGQNRQQVRILDATGRWQDLALLVAQVGYINDLSYYYL